MSIELRCLKKEISTGGHTYPVFIGFMPAEEILSVAEAPSFSKNDSHQQLADNVLKPPVEDWQRPLDEDRIVAIGAVFSDSGNLMPNPVLLSQNVTAEYEFEIEPEMISQGVVGSTWTIRIPSPSQHNKPLWILDGQHRINGLAASMQKSNPIPLVLLLKVGSHGYNGGLLAKIFAQVTTSATELDHLHNEWLTFAFDLEKYDPARSPQAGDHKKAFMAAAELCRMQKLSDDSVNPFFNKIAFNLHSQSQKLGNFAYDCASFQELLFNYYYSQAPDVAHLSSRHLADEIGRALNQLGKSVPGPHAETVFFGDEAHSQRYMQDGFVVGALARLLKFPAPIDWAGLLEELRFSETDWNFHSWTVSLHGRSGTTSKKLARKVLSIVFANGSLPPSSRNLAEYLKGNDASVTLVFSEITDSGRASRRGQKSVKLTTGNKFSQVIKPCKHVKLAAITDNIAVARVLDKRPVAGEPVEYSLKRGLLLNAAIANPLNLVVNMTHYGGTRSQADIDIKW